MKRGPSTRREEARSACGGDGTAPSVATQTGPLSRQRRRLLATAERPRISTAHTGSYVDIMSATSENSAQGWTTDVSSVRHTLSVPDAPSIWADGCAQPTPHAVHIREIPGSSKRHAAATDARHVGACRDITAAVTAESAQAGRVMTGNRSVHINWPKWHIAGLRWWP